MKSILKSLKPLKLPLIIVGVVFGLLITSIYIVPIIQKMTYSKEPIVAIKAENNKVYKKTSTIKKSDFVVYVKHKDGKTNKIDSNQFNISTEKIAPVGKTTNVTVSLKDNKDITYIAKVKNDRQKIVGFQCGYPDVTKVEAILYSNGELSFEGEGDILTFDRGYFPWLQYEEEKDFPVTAITFGDKITPTNMNYWFEDMQTVTYVGTIPNNVKTMISTFSGCINLETMADTSNCTQLLDMTATYSDCTSLQNTVSIPASVTLCKATFSGCTSLQKAPDMSQAVSLDDATEMFGDCKKLVSIELSPNVKNLSSTFSGCINLQNMPIISESVENMNSTFYGDISLTNLTNVPINVTNVASCFSGCELAEGNLTINTSTDDYGAMFDGATLATTLNLTGESGKLNEYALTSGNNRVLVNSQIPVEPEY